jgi:hypothetical protein
MVGMKDWEQIGEYLFSGWETLQIPEKSKKFMLVI